MNLLPAYELTIVERMAGIEIPDMADAIWGRIEAALDVEMPVQDTPSTPEGTPFFKKPAVWMIGAGILAIIIALFIVSKNRNTAPVRPRHLPQPTVPAIPPDTTSKQDFKPPGTPQPVPKKNTNTTNEKHVADTAAYWPLINKEMDSLLKNPPLIIAPPADTMKTVKRRPKYGVEVSDSDYRFDVKPKQ